MINPDNDKKWSRIRNIVFLLLVIAFAVLCLVTMLIFAQNYQKIISNFALILLPIALAIKNKPVTTHSIDLMLDCGHIIVEPVEAAIFTPDKGEKRFCPTCQKETTIKNVGTPFWNDNGSS